MNYRSEDFVAFVDDVTNGRGVDVAFDTVGGAVTTDTFRAMAFNGRHLIIGFASGIESEERPCPIQPSIYGNFDLVGICFAYVGLAAAGPSVRHELPVHRPGHRHLEPDPAAHPGRDDPPGDRPADRVRRGSRRARGARAARGRRAARWCTRRQLAEASSASRS